MTDQPAPDRADAAVDQPLVWIDLEMTGLDPGKDVVLEVAVIVTDGQLETVLEGPDLVVAQPESALASMEPVVAQMHRRSGLDVAVRRSRLSLAEAQHQSLAFIRRYVPQPQSAPLAGNSIGTDRVFLRAAMPQLEAHLHYRNVDVSTLKELARRWYPKVARGAAVKQGGHRAMADLRESIKELRYYRSELFAPPE